MTILGFGTRVRSREPDQACPGLFASYFASATDGNRESRLMRSPFGQRLGLKEWSGIRPHKETSPITFGEVSFKDLMVP